MSTNEQFTVFGENVEVLVDSNSTNRSFCVLAQTCPPGGGPPPHVHDREDEIFTVLQGEFEVFDGKVWHRLPKGEFRYKLRGQPHTFRNCGTTDGKILVTAIPGGFEEYLRLISPLVIPQDMARLIEISDEHGIKFLGPEPPDAPPA